MTILDGKALSEKIKSQIKVEVDALLEVQDQRPHLAAVLVGDDPASQVYVRNKVLSCEQVGFESTLIKKHADVSEQELLDVIDDLNSNDDIDGFIVQLPLPKHINEEKIIQSINPKKDVDGFHPMNVGRMTIGLPTYLPATPYGILKLIEEYKIPTEGKYCVILGRSNIVGTPMSILLSRKAYPGNCTVCLAHSRSKNIEEEIKKADIIIAALGIPHFLNGDNLKEGVTIIDVGINRKDDASRKRGYRLVGDVDYLSASKKAAYITPVPGGVGPLTVTALMLNTLKAFKKEVYG